MGNEQYKGTNIMHLRKRMKEAGSAQEELFCSRLSPEDLLVYKNAIAAGWYPMDAVGRIFNEAAKILYAHEGFGFLTHQPDIQFSREETTAVALKCRGI